MGRFDALDGLCEEGVRDGVFPGAAYSIGGRFGQRNACFGRHKYGLSPLITPDTLWDLASLTKVVATTSLAMLLEDEGVLNLDARVAEILPEFDGIGKGAVTVRNLLLHDSGLPAYIEDIASIPSATEMAKRILTAPLTQAPGEETIYSCVGFCVLRSVLERLQGDEFSNAVRSKVLRPLGMSETSFCPRPALRARCAPTAIAESWRTESRLSSVLQGVVHDPIAYQLGGISGNAGLFATVGDLGRFAEAVLGAFPPFRRSSLVRWTSRSAEGARRALGWDLMASESPMSGDRFSSSSFGHSGYTGTSIWIDPDAQIFAVLLTNRIHPDDDNLRIKDFRPKFHDAVYGALL